MTKAIRKEFRSHRHGPEGNDGEEEDEDEDEDLHDGNWYQDRAEAFKRAWAAWVIAEDALREDRYAFGPQSFGLIALGVMLGLVKELREEGYLEWDDY